MFTLLLSIFHLHVVFTFPLLESIKKKVFFLTQESTRVARWGVGQARCVWSISTVWLPVSARFTVPPSWPRFVAPTASPTRAGATWRRRRVWCSAPSLWPSWVPAVSAGWNWLFFQVVLELNYFPTSFSCAYLLNFLAHTTFFFLFLYFCFHSFHSLLCDLFLPQKFWY